MGLFTMTDIFTTKEMYGAGFRAYSVSMSELEGLHVQYSRRIER